MGTIHVHDGTQGRRAERRGFSLFDKKMGRGDGLVINGVNLEVGAMPGARKDFWRGKWKRNGREGGFHYLTRKWTTKADQLIGPLGTKAGTMKADQLIGPLHYEGTTKADQFIQRGTVQDERGTRRGPENTRRGRDWGRERGDSWGTVHDEGGKH